MRNTILVTTAAFGVALLLPQAGQAQGTLYLSSLNQTYTGAKAVGGDSWLAMPFIAGNNPGGYVLDSVQLGMADASGNPSGFGVAIYTSTFDPIGRIPGSSLVSLIGPVSPTSADVYSYTPATSIALAPRGYYYVVMTGAAAVAIGAFNWGLSAYPPATANDGWVGLNSVLRSSDGISGWSEPLPYRGMGQLAIYATAIPEPGVLGLAILGGLLLLRQHRKAAEPAPSP